LLLPPDVPPPPRPSTWEEEEVAKLEKEDPQDSQDDDEESEEGEADDTKASDSRSGRRRRKKKPAKPSFKRLLRRLRRRATSIFAMIAGAILLALTFFRVGESQGAREGKEAALRDMAVLEARRVYTLPAEAQQQLDAALLEVRSGNTLAGAEATAELAEKFPDVASLNYAAGLGAIQAGDFKKAIAFANASIDKGERVSDSHVLISIAEAQLRAEEPGQQLVNPQLRVREILDEAIAADPMNASARMELGSLLRYMGDEAGALRELGAAKARLHPVDSHLAVDVTVALIEVENLPMEALQPSEPTVDDVRVLFPAAYIAMRNENFELGIRLLQRCKNLLPADSFFYLVNDRAFQRFAYRDDMKALMQ
jgi:tetratricopeptide (TPR) repeat protein